MPSPKSSTSSSAKRGAAGGGNYSFPSPAGAAAASQPPLAPKALLATPDKESRKRPAAALNATSMVAASVATTAKPATTTTAAATTTTTTRAPKEKSTITTVTPASAAQMNVYDAVLAEASDLFQAASEAQQLGRLKMASSYLLLLHARLVGLGKRFDKAERPPTTAGSSSSSPGLVTPTKKKARQDKDRSGTTSRHATPRNHKNQRQAASRHDNPLLTPNTAKVLSEMLPDDIELDQAMMEHLAKAAAELHAARTGKKRHATAWNVGLTGYDYADASPPRRGPTTDWELRRQQQQQQPVSNTALVWSLSEMRILQTALQQAAEQEENAGDKPHSATNTTTATGAKSNASSKAVAAGGGGTSKAKAIDADALAQTLGRNPAQVRAFLRNQNTKRRIAADLALESSTGGGITAGDGVATGADQHPDGTSRSSHPSPQAAAASSGTAPYTTTSTTTTSSNTATTTADAAADDSPKKKRGGRGPKPPTTALHTVPNAACNAKILLQGGFLPESDDPSHWLIDDQNDNNNPTAAAASTQKTGTVAAAPTATSATANKATAEEEGNHPPQNEPAKK